MNRQAQRPAVLAVDAGNSKTDVALVAATGDVLAWVRGGGFEPHSQGLGKAIGGLADLVRAAASEAGGGPVADHVTALLANCDLPEERETLTKAITAQGWAPDVTVDNDTFAVLRAGSGVPYGVAVVCGAGMNCVARSPSGRTVRYLALGRRSGDWGGGEFLGEEVLWCAVRDEDGRGPRTDLREAVAAHFDLPDVTAVCIAFHLRELPGERLHELVPLLFEVAGGGDVVARSLVERLGDEVAGMALAALDRLAFDRAPVPVVLGGGVLTASHPLLLNRVEARFRASGADVDLRILTAPPIVGSALHGFDELGLGGRAAEERLRAAFSRSLRPDVRRPVVEAVGKFSKDSCLE
ncbi:N-acetylglucosamine kinase [Actinomadura rubrisoli]|uniref:N-acetylglucosamine kinase n=1 Tax=Actinomadura rubrisoli TaxID=2530368 RepID=UPI001FB7958E|nr:BadF/BadG/BcrA/BcrD ATPase family protein [Actinomadura rubrisoli]